MIAEYQTRVIRHEEAERRLLENRDLAAVTKDDRRITLQANIELVEELKDAIRFGAEGIGLYRSEFLYISKSPAAAERGGALPALQSAGRGDRAAAGA